jgi:hypothetical protein
LIDLDKKDDKVAGFVIKFMQYFAYPYPDRLVELLDMIATEVPVFKKMSQAEILENIDLNLGHRHDDQKEIKYLLTQFLFAINAVNFKNII